MTRVLISDVKRTPKNRSLAMRSAAKYGGAMRSTTSERRYTAVAKCGAAFIAACAPAQNISLVLRK